MVAKAEPRKRPRAGAAQTRGPRRRRRRGRGVVTARGAGAPGVGGAPAQRRQRRRRPARRRRARPRRLEQQDAVHAQHHRLLGGARQHLALPLPVPAERRRFVVARQRRRYRCATTTTTTTAVPLRPRHCFARRQLLPPPHRLVDSAVQLPEIPEQSVCIPRMVSRIQGVALPLVGGCLIVHWCLAYAHPVAV
ncbi:Protein of unknown function [Gryllus bimaculatus]|nr:Protein of unknown function [Gryllus bimaculatus]